MAQTVKNLPAVQETWAQSLGCEDPLKEDMAIHSSILAQRIPRTEESGGLQFIGPQRVGYNSRDLTPTSHFPKNSFHYFLDHFSLSLNIPT